MKYLLELILSTIIIFFVWNTLKRIFYKKFYHFVNDGNKQQTQNRNTTAKKEEKIKWDAETVDYEEIEK
ncbi:MAG: hypothetical protein JSS94_00550 [Bacteroidetes bacterium]|nr:hypothetical protein [Bacteroidota bacterium]